MSKSKLGVEILSSGPVTVQEGDARWGDGRSVHVEGEIESIEIFRNGEAAYFLRICSDGKLILTTYRGRLTTTLDTNLHLTPTHLWED
jgi:hypothetical protein